MTDKFSDKIAKTEAEWRQQLTPEQYQVARACGTERAFTGQYWNKHDDGTYHCVCCGALLFGSETKFDSGTGWPSFFAAADRKNIARTHRHQLWHDSHRGALRPLRCAFGPRVSRWSRANRAALLHELGVARLQAEEVSNPTADNRKRWSAGRPRPAGRANARPSIVV